MSKTSRYIRVKVIPKSSPQGISEILKESIDGEEVLTYKIRIKSAPEKGKANDELIKFLAKEFATPKENIEIISGKTDRIKLIRIG